MNEASRWTRACDDLNRGARFELTDLGRRALEEARQEEDDELPPEPLYLTQDRLAGWGEPPCA